MEQYKVVEIFTSINGEGIKAGQLSVFVRFQGCNLNCSFCDTQWANREDAKYTLMTAQEILEHIKQTGIKNVTLTGGEPLKQPGVDKLLLLLSKEEDIQVEIETNGSVSIKSLDSIKNRPSVTMDYKLASSGMESFMNLDNMQYLQKRDTVKFVCGDIHDMERAREIMNIYALTKKCHVYYSPVFGVIDLQEMVEFMKQNQMNDVTLQLQLHKFIWDPNERGV